MSIVTYLVKDDLSNEDSIVITTDFEIEVFSRSKKLVSFCIVLVHLIDGKSVPSVQFDSAHGVVHVHRFYKGEEFVEVLESYSISKETLFEIREDIYLNWQNYKKWFMNKKGL